MPLNRFRSASPVARQPRHESLSALSPLDLLWHALNLIFPAAAMGLIAALLAKLLWRQELRGVPSARLALGAGSAVLFASLGGLLMAGRDGRMATYGAMVLACALGLWWAAWWPGWPWRSRR